MDATPVAPTPCCDRCGTPEAVGIAGRWLCVDCYQVCGSCCPEFPTHDLAAAAVEDAATRNGTATSSTSG